ncbi:hypothetical protein F2P81_022495 [Scophthalmus maximus]|uniref:G-protein coupled receptors family 1 profile domain-containing protein n=2 Tax=Scophthalmus maximus TaxID=52904 RepID=A0A6A4S519_SCOMX|nr:hypothetical protein F2P81_022495 [Scophthalmus maximus]
MQASTRVCVTSFWLIRESSSVQASVDPPNCHALKYMGTGRQGTLSVSFEFSISHSGFAGSIGPSHPFPTADVPNHAHYTIGIVILAVGITGMLGNFLVIYAFCRSRGLRTPSNIFIINLAVTDFLMCFTQTPVFFITSMHKRWIFGKKGCELYAFCGALFGICSMMTLMVIALDRAISKINSQGTRDSAKKFHKMRSEWKMAKIALIVILLFVISWAPYSCVALTAFAGYADMLTPYMNSVPAVIAKASAIHNPIIYAITHPKYRSALSRYIPYLGALLCISGRDPLSSSFQSTRRSTLTSQSESKGANKTRHSSQSESESAHLSDTEEDGLSRTPVTHQLSADVKQVRRASQRSKVRSHNTGEFERTAAHNPTDPAVCHLSPITVSMDPLHIVVLYRLLDNLRAESGPRTACKPAPPVIATSISSPSILHSPPGLRGNHKLTQKLCPVVKEPLDVARLQTTALQSGGDEITLARIFPRSGDMKRHRADRSGPQPSHNSTEHRPTYITPGSKAAGGSLAQGDIISSIDGVSTDGMTHLEAQNKIKAATNTLSLTMQNVEYTPSFNPIALKDSALSTHKPIEVRGPGGKATIVHAQYNTPISMYSQDAIMDAIAGQSQAKGHDSGVLPVKDPVVDCASPVYQAVIRPGEMNQDMSEWARRAANLQSKSFRILAHITGTEYLQDPDEEALQRSREKFESEVKGPRFAKLKNWHNGLSAQILNVQE